MLVALLRFVFDWFDYEYFINGFSIIRLILRGDSDVSLGINGYSVVRPVNLNVASGVSEIALEIRGASHFVIQVGAV